MNYVEALEYIHTINWEVCKPGLDRIRVLCEELGHPERKLKFIHVAGTNGKGSFCAVTESILREAGYKTGLFTSPYVRDFNERMKFCGEPISDTDLAEICGYIKPVSDKMEQKPTEFELITAVAFEYFKRKECDIVILEAGMGGRLDSTNIIELPELSVITGIAVDHVAYLGDTVEKIAAEKAGIIKQRRPVLFGGTDSSALDVIKDYSEKKESALYTVDYSALKINSMTLNGTNFNFGNRTHLDISLLGNYQPRNAALALTATDILQNIGYKITDNHIRSGLKKTKWSARFEKLCDNPVIIYDGGHNLEGIDAAVSSIKNYFGNGKVTLVTGVMKDKDYKNMATRLAEITERVFTVTPPNPRSLDAKHYAAFFNSIGVTATPAESVKEALSLAISYAAPVICLGSLYLYSEVAGVLEAMRADSKLP